MESGDPASGLDIDDVGLHVRAARQVKSAWPTDFRPGLTGVPLVSGRG